MTVTTAIREMREPGIAFAKTLLRLTMHKGAAMSAKLLVAGIGLTLLALTSESTLTKPAVAAKADATDAADPEPAVLGAHHTFGRMGTGIEFVVTQSVTESLSKSEETLQTLEPQLRDSESKRGREARRIADEVTLSIEKAREELGRHRSFAAMDQAMHAANRCEDLKRLLIERR